MTAQTPDPDGVRRRPDGYPILEPDAPRRMAKILQRSGLHTLDQLFALDDPQRSRMRGLGERVLAQVRLAVARAMG